LTGETESDSSEPEGERARGRAIPPFDPVAGMRAMADIQADGLRAASELLDRMLGAERGSSPPPRDPPPDGNSKALLDAWAEMLQRIAAGLARPGEPDGALTVSLETAGVGPAVRLALGGSGSDDDEAGVEVWLQNGTPSAVGPLALRSGPLTDSDGEVLEGAEVRFEPGELESLPPRSARAVGVSLAVIGSPQAGVYRGMIQADGAPNLWLPLEVAIGTW